MSVAGVIGLFRGKPAHPAGPEGQMPLGDHLRELRARLLRVALLLVVAMVIAWFFYDQLFGLILRPYNDARVSLGHEVNTKPYISGAAGPLMMKLKIVGLAALVGSSPYWLYQIWAFIVPGLHPKERRWTKTFVAVAGPLFLAGVAIGYYVLPKGLQVLLSFTPAHMQSLLEFSEYFAFFTRMLLVFGVAFEIPLFVVLLNLAGVLPARALSAYRPWIIVGVFVFAAVATPSTDPFSMLMLAIPMTALFMVSEVVARTVDRRRAAAAALSFDGVGDDEASPIEEVPEDVPASQLGEEDD